MIYETGDIVEVWSGVFDDQHASGFSQLGDDWSVWPVAPQPGDEWIRCRIIQMEDGVLRVKKLDQVGLLSVPAVIVADDAYIRKDTTT